MEWSRSSLDLLQKRVLAHLSEIEPPFILGGGGALAIYYGHRQTKALDLFWEEVETLAGIPTRIQECLRRAGLSTTVIQQSPGFVRLRVIGDGSAITVDLIADPTERLDRPVSVRVDDVAIAAESPRDLLVNKLCALLSRSELRDLFDIGVLVARGVSLDDAILSAPRKDGGFSPLTLAWVLRSLDVRGLASASGFGVDDLRTIEQVRSTLIDKLLES